MEKCLKIAGPLPWNDTKNAKNSEIHNHKKLQKMHSSALMQKCLKLAGPL